MEADWPAYFRATQDKPLHYIWDHLDPYLKPGLVALELGCGTGAGVRRLVDRGLKVLAVDQEPEALEITRARLPEGADVHLLKAQFEDLGLEPNSLDIVVAGFALFFLRTWQFDPVWRRLVQALRPGGVFAGQLLGVNDEWAARGYTVHTAAQVATLLAPFETLFFEEVERDGETALREPKHWHVFHIVARKLPA